jgi:hypothetical protein
MMLHKTNKTRPFIELILLEGWHRRSVYSLVSVLWLSGMSWLIFDGLHLQMGEFGTEPRWKSWEWLALWLPRLHGLLAFFAVFGLGTLVLAHMRRAWILRKNRITGVFLSTWVGLLFASGYALYYFVERELDAYTSLMAWWKAQPWLISVHWILGALLPILLLVHIVIGRRRKKAVI